MRALRLAVLPLLVATSLAAQAPPAAPAAATPRAVVAPYKSAFFDVAALVDNRQRFGFEPLIFGRWAIGLVGTHYQSNSQQIVAYGPPPIVPVASPVLCPVTGCPPGPFPGSTSSYSAWSLDLTVRYYPAALSFNDPRHRLMAYVGEFVGYHRRTYTQAIYAVPLGYTPVDTVGLPPIVPPVMPTYSSPLRLTGWEPGAEAGVRLIPLAPVFVDVGGWFKLVTIDDPTQRLRPGQVDARLVVAVGIGW